MLRLLAICFALVFLVLCGLAMHEGGLIDFIRE